MRTVWSIERTGTANPRSRYVRTASTTTWALIWILWTLIVPMGGHRYRLKRNNLVIARKG